MRGRLTGLVAATMCLTLLAFLIPLALLLRTMAQDRAVVAARADAQSLISLVGSADTATLRDSVQQVAATAHGPLTVFLPDGTVLGTAAPRTTAVQLAARAGVSRSVQQANGREIVIAVLGRPDGTAVIRAFVSTAEMTRGVYRAWLVLAGLGMALLMLGLLVADRLGRSLTRPITALSAVSHRLARAELTARAHPEGPPEIREVAGALNHLAARIQELLREERERVADLSHRLRTPLTSLRLETEAMTDSEDTARVARRVDDLERAVTSFISEARRRSAAQTDTVCEATAVVRDRVAFWTVLAEDTARVITLDVPAEGPLPVAVSADDLGAALDALIGNVFAHTPDGTPFTITLAARSTGGGALLTVADDGPGLPADHIRRGVSGTHSTGLGLDIVHRTAHTSGGRLELGSSPAGGARVTLELGPPLPHA